MFITVRWFPGNIRRMLQKAGFFDKVDPGCMYVSVHDAVVAVVSGEGPHLPKDVAASLQVNKSQRIFILRQPYLVC